MRDLTGASLHDTLSAAECERNLTDQSDQYMSRAARAWNRLVLFYHRLAGPCWSIRDHAWNAIGVELTRLPR